jgi:hypothetical protein
VEAFVRLHETGRLRLGGQALGIHGPGGNGQLHHRA